MVTILPALRQVREDLAGLLERKQVERICRDLEHTWRERQLDPYTTLHLFILQMVNQNTAMTHLPHLSGERFSASAYCQARQRLPLELIQRLVDSFAQGLESTTPAALWHGHRLLLVDGSGFSMPDTPELRAYFGQPSQQRKGCGFPVGHLLAMMDAHSGFLYDVIISPLRTHDMKHAADLHPRLSPGDIVVADRGFCSYAHLALLLRANLHAVLRIHQRVIVDFHPHRVCARDLPKGNTGLPHSRWVQRLGPCDQIVDWCKPKCCPQWMNAEEFANLPQTIRVREIKLRIREAGGRVREVTLVTTLLDAQRYPAQEIGRLYRQRWQVEIHHPYCLLSRHSYHGPCGLGCVSSGSRGLPPHVRSHSRRRRRRCSSSASASTIHLPRAPGSCLAFTQPRRIQLYRVAWGTCNARTRSMNHHSLCARQGADRGTGRGIIRPCLISRCRTISLLNLRRRLAGCQPSLLSCFAIRPVVRPASRSSNIRSIKRE